jgi:hypothetical protein
MIETQNTNTAIKAIRFANRLSNLALLIFIPKAIIVKIKAGKTILLVFMSKTPHFMS